MQYDLFFGVGQFDLRDFSMSFSIKVHLALLPQGLREVTQKNLFLMALRGGGGG